MLLLLDTVAWVEIFHVETHGNTYGGGRTWFRAIKVIKNYRNGGIDQCDKEKRSMFYCGVGTVCPSIVVGREQHQHPQHQKNTHATKQTPTKTNETYKPDVGVEPTTLR